ncbi:mCG147608 [Mus musculus]|nr:mCG147608 [Mus musculus]
MFFAKKKKKKKRLGIVEAHVCHPSTGEAKAAGSGAGIQTECGGLNENGLHRLTELYTGHQRGALYERTKRCGLVGGSVSLGVDPEVPKPIPSLEALFLLSADSDIQLLATSPAPCLPACHPDLHLHENGLSPQLNAFPCKSHCGFGVASQ